MSAVNVSVFGSKLSSAVSDDMHAGQPSDAVINSVLPAWPWPALPSATASRVMIGRPATTAATGLLQRRVPGSNTDAFTSDAVVENNVDSDSCQIATA